MSCFILPASPYLKLAFLPRFVIGYPQSYAAGPASLQTTLTANPAGLNPTNFLPHALPQNAVVTNGAFHANVPSDPVSPPLSAVHLTAIATPGGQPVSGFINKNTPRHERRRPWRNLKRRAEDINKSPSPNPSLEGSTGEGESRVHSTCEDLLRPLYCKACRVTLNAPAQAKQHYEGKNHCKKIKLYDTDSDTDKEKSTSPDSVNSDQVLCQTDGNIEAVIEINPEVYCRTCGVSFNSPKQSHQHYQGKSHAKKTRASQQQLNGRPERRSRYRTDYCKAREPPGEQPDQALHFINPFTNGQICSTNPTSHGPKWKRDAVASTKQYEFIHSTTMTTAIQHAQ